MWEALTTAANKSVDLTGRFIEIVRKVYTFHGAGIDHPFVASLLCFPRRKDTLRVYPTACPCPKCDKPHFLEDTAKTVPEFGRDLFLSTIASINVGVELKCQCGLTWVQQDHEVRGGLY